MPANCHKTIVTFFTILVVFVFAIPVARAANVGEVVEFNVDANYDAPGRQKVSAVLVASTPSLYFYVETDVWNAKNTVAKDRILANLNITSDEFSNKIYPTLTSLFGQETTPGLDGDVKITILFESGIENIGGYFRSADQYSKLQVPSSNQREMLYLPVAHLENPRVKEFLAHEFVHLITFNQKDRLNGVAEETWLNEARADYASTILGYDDNYEGSNLASRVRDFLASPNNSLPEWQNTKYDYAVVNVFMHYFVDHYGIQVLADSLKSKLTGIASINEALAKSGAKENFSQIFTNWTIATVINNCAIGVKYCYTGPSLSSLKINPSLIFLPLTGDSSLSTNNSTKNWVGNWQKIIGGNGDLKLQFSAAIGLNFKVPYIVYDKNNDYVVKFIQLEGGRGEINIKDFGINYNSLVVMPSLQSKTTGFGANDLTYPYVFTISVTKPGVQDDSALIKQLQDQIAVLNKQIADILAANGQTPNLGGCALQNNLYVGVSNSASVKCLQQFLAGQGQTIYPEALVTGFFGSLTRSAVVRFQVKYGIPATGFVGVLTRAKINALLNSHGG